MRIALATAMALCAQATIAAECQVTKAQYSALDSGTSYAAAVAILGCEGEEMSSSDMAGYKTVMYMWGGKSAGANMNAMFQNDALITKAQFGLK